jgi:hypothetical protein
MASRIHLGIWLYVLMVANVSHEYTLLLDLCNLSAKNIPSFCLDIVIEINHSYEFKLVTWK